MSSSSEWTPGSPEALKEQVSGMSLKEIAIHERLNRLNEMRLGRALVYRGRDGYILLGYSLALNLEQSSHVLLFNDGEVLLVEEPEQGYQKRAYSQIFNTYPIPFYFDTKDMDQVKHFFIGGAACQSKIILDVHDPDIMPIIEESVNRAIDVSKQLKERRAIALAMSAGIVIDVIDDQIPPRYK